VGRSSEGAGVTQETSRSSAAASTGFVLLTLASAQFLMTLDMSVMNVSIATVASDLGTTVTGIQTAITLYTLVMATLMITGGKIGTIIGRRRAFALGCIVYAAGSLTTGLAPDLTVLIAGWSFLEGIGAALIMPAVVALVASNFPPAERPRAYGLVAAAGAVAVAVGPIVGGAATTYASWRYVFFAEVVIALVLLVTSRRIADAPPEKRARLDLVGTALSVLGLGMIVYGVLRSSDWGWVVPRENGLELFGISATFWFVVAGLLVVWLFLRWERRVLDGGGDPLIRPQMLRNSRLTGGLIMFFFQYMLQAGVFFIVPLFLSVVLALTALETGVRLVPLSITLIVAAVGVPKVWPRANPRRVVRIGMVLVLAGILGLLAGIDLDASAAVVSMPLALMGLGIGCLASQLGAVTVSAVPEEEGGEAGGLQNTAMNLGASMGTALAGSILILGLTVSLVQGIQQNPDVPAEIGDEAGTRLSTGVQFVSDAQLEEALGAAGVPEDVTASVVEANSEARIDALNAALAVLALAAVGALFFTDRIPKDAVGEEASVSDEASVSGVES
jgi:EmrB/QacA subfamily drug resistance transporter